MKFFYSVCNPLSVLTIMSWEECVSRVLYRLALREVSLFSTCPENTLKTRTIQRYNSYRLRGIPHYFPLTHLVSVYRSFAEYSENKRGIRFSLLQTAGGYHLSVNPSLALKRWEPCCWVRMRITDWGVQTLFSAFYPLYLFSVLQRNTLKTRIIPSFLSYRQSVNRWCL